MGDSSERGERKARGPIVGLARVCHVRRDRSLAFGGPDECPTRGLVGHPACRTALARRYSAERRALGAAAVRPIGSQWTSSPRGALVEENPSPFRHLPIETAPVVKGTLKAGADSISFTSRSVDRPPLRDTTRLLRFQQFGTGDNPEEMRTIGERLSTLRGQNLALWVGQGGQRNATAIEGSVVNSPLATPALRNEHPARND